MALERIDFEAIQASSSSEAFRTELIRVYELALKLGFDVYHDTELRSVQLTHGSDIASDLVDADPAHFEAISTMLELMLKMRENAKPVTKQSDLEKRVETVEQLLSEVKETMGTLCDKRAQLSEQQDVNKRRSKRISDLRQRAKAMGNSVSNSYVLSGYTYVRHRHRANSDKGPSFTVHNAFDKNHHSHDNIRWDFGYEELDSLEKFIEHDEKLYMDYFNKR